MQDSSIPMGSLTWFFPMGNLTWFFSHGKFDFAVFHISHGKFDLCFFHGVLTLVTVPVTNPSRY